MSRLVTRRESHRWAVPVVVALTATVAGCAGLQLTQNVHQVRAIAKEARDNGAYRCAPRELALAETHLEFATVELDQGDYFRARDHLQIADENARLAHRLSPRDRCTAPPKPGDRDGDGIPDNDKDGVLDTVDKCPNEPGPADNNGCPKKYEHIVVTQEKIELKQKIFFDTDKATIQPRSFSLLDEIASVLRGRPTMTVRIEGHTDSRGSRPHNLKLSQARSDSVRQHLIGLGVDAHRMESRGYGPDQPIETNKTAGGREKNRRVEFFITQQ